MERPQRKDKKRAGIDEEEVRGAFAFVKKREEKEEESEMRRLRSIAAN